MTEKLKQDIEDIFNYCTENGIQIEFHGKLHTVPLSIFIKETEGGQLNIDLDFGSDRVYSLFWYPERTRSVSDIIIELESDGFRFTRPGMFTDMIVGDLERAKTEAYFNKICAAYNYVLSYCLANNIIVVFDGEEINVVDHMLQHTYLDPEDPEVYLGRARVRGLFDLKCDGFLEAKIVRCFEDAGIHFFKEFNLRKKFED